ncbi:hypothetical protein KY335_01245 [Candidatus Woesearchaeota archaeon]|nr:hypothetical protein [Candidatus Woesearchaeota archaeon]MBW3013850.1 hypothetical protein [Candidatus Woesearchaeota archaeon]
MKRKRFLDIRFLTKHVLNDLGFWIVGIVGIFNIIILGVVYSIFPALQMTSAVAEEAAKGLTRDEAVLNVIEQMDPTSIVLFGSIKALAIMIVGFLLILLVLTYFKGKIYLSLQDKKMDKAYFKQFYVFNIFYYLIFISIPLIILITIKPMAAAKIILVFALAYAYLTPLIRANFRSSETYFRNYVLILKRSFRSAVQLGVLLRVLVLAFLFFVLYVISSGLSMLGFIGAVIFIVLFLYLSAVSRIIIFNKIQNVK